MLEMENMVKGVRGIGIPMLYSCVDGLGGTRCLFLRERNGFRLDSNTADEGLISMREGIIKIHVDEVVTVVGFMGGHSIDL